MQRSMRIGLRGEACAGYREEFLGQTEKAAGRAAVSDLDDYTLKPLFRLDIPLTYLSATGLVGIG